MSASMQTRDGRRVRARGGFTLIELLIVIVILGILATVVVFAVGGISERGEESVCATDERTLATAVEAYFGRFETTDLPLPGSPPPTDVYETTLKDAGLLHGVSVHWELDSSGDLTVQTGGLC